MTQTILSFVFEVQPQSAELLVIFVEQLRIAEEALKFGIPALDYLGGLP